jgi:hypothetical protein
MTIDDTHPAKVQNDPATGTKAAISPRASIVMKTIAPTMAYDISIDAGPPVARLFPVPKNRPVPMVPPIAIILTCLEDNFLAKVSVTAGVSGDETPRKSTSAKFFSPFSLSFHRPAPDAF